MIIKQYQMSEMSEREQQKKFCFSNKRLSKKRFPRVLQCFDAVGRAGTACGL